MQDSIGVGFHINQDGEVPEIRMVVAVNGQIVSESDMTALIMTIAAEKVFLQDGKCIGRLVNPDGSIGDLVKFKASKVEVH